MRDELLQLTGQSANVRVDRRSAQVLEEVIVDVNAIRARLAGKDFIEVRQVIVDEGFNPVKRKADYTRLGA